MTLKHLPSKRWSDALPDRIECNVPRCKIEKDSLRFSFSIFIVSLFLVLREIREINEKNQVFGTQANGYSCQRAAARPHILLFFSLARLILNIQVWKDRPVAQQHQMIHVMETQTNRLCLLKKENIDSSGSICIQFVLRSRCEALYSVCFAKNEGIQSKR